MYYKKAIVAIADGLGDRPNPLLNGLTPLQKASTPNLDKLAAQGICGMVDLLAPGIPVGTDMGHLILFGGDPADYPGRGPIEACGIDMDVQEGDVILRCNLATIDQQGVVIDRRAGRISESAEELAKAITGMKLSDDVTAYFRPATEHRAVLILRGPDLSDKITDSDPKEPHQGKRYLQVTATDNSSSAQKTARLLNEFLAKSHVILDAHPMNLRRKAQGKLAANFILTRGAGNFKKLESTPQRQGFRGCCIAAETTVLGVAKLTGFDIQTDARFTANLETDFALKAEMTLKAIEQNDLVFVHIKATDLAGHDNLPFEKVEAIECYDRMVGAILDRLPEHTYFALAADHSTPCEVREHTGEPVPVVIYGQDIRRDHVLTYDEIACAEGSLKRLTGTSFINTIFDYMGYSHKQGS